MLVREDKDEGSAGEGVSRAENPAYKHIRLLEKAGLVKRFRMDRYTYVHVAEYVDRETFEKRVLNVLKRKDEIKSAIEKYDISADLFRCV